MNKDLKFLATMAEAKRNSAKGLTKLQKAKKALRKTLSGNDEEPIVSEDDLKAAAARFIKMNAHRGSPELQEARRKLRQTLGHAEEPEPESIKQDGAPDWLEELLQAERQTKLEMARKRLRDTLSKRQLNEERL